MSRRILLVDDDPRFVAQLDRSLSRRGFDVECALDGSNALRLARLFRPDAILLDMRLGSDSGLHIIPRLRKLADRPRIIVLTGYASIATAVEAIKRGASDYLPKPAHLQAILNAIAGTPERTEAAGETSAPQAMAPLASVEWEHIQQALADSDGNISAAARRLQMHRRTLQRKLSKKPTLN